MNKENKAKENPLKGIDTGDGEYWVIEGSPKPITQEEFEESLNLPWASSAEEDWGMGFGDKVRVRLTPVTEEKGLAGLVGMVCGQTTPSITRGLIGEIVGEPKQDYAINVLFEDLGTSIWFAPELLELIESAPR